MKKNRWIKTYPISLNTLLLLVLTIAIAGSLWISFSLIKSRVERNMIEFMQVSVLREQYRLLSQEIENNFTKVALLTETTAKEIQKQLESEPKYTEGEFNKKINQYYEIRADGTLRSRHKDTTNRHQMFSFFSNWQEPNLFEKRILIQAVEFFGPYNSSLHQYVFNTYFTTATISWDYGSYAWPLAIKANEDLTKHPWFYEADPINNPEKKQVWTDVYYDAVNSEWMISSLFPVYVNDSFIGVVGNDILLKEIVLLTIKQPYSQGYQFFIDEQGNIIAHPELGLSLPVNASNNDTLNIKHLKDSSLNESLAYILKQTEVGTIFSGKDKSNYLVYAPIKTLNWRLVYLIDSFNLVSILKQIFSSLAFIYFIVALFIIVLVSIIVRNFAHRPLMRLLKAMKMVKSGVSGATINQKSYIKEVSQLMKVFNEMTIALENSNKNIQSKNLKIENISNHLRLLNNTIPDAVMVIDENGIIIESNRTLEAITGYSEPEIEGKAYRHIFTDFETVNYIQQALNADINEKSNFFESEFIKKNGDKKDVLIRFRPIQIDNTFNLMLVLTDISKRKKIERDLKLAKEKAEKSDQLKTAFLANMSHEIRTPMNGIVGFAQLLGDDSLSREEINSYISIIKKSSDQLLHIIGDILDISKIETGQIELNYESFELTDFIEQLFLFFKPSFEQKDIVLTVKKPDTKVLLYSDQNRLNQILTNLLTNAFKYTNSGTVEFGFVEEESTYQFFVIDSGLGIAPEYLCLVFERFKQTDLGLQKQNGGAGLGLAISRGLVERLGGKIWVESVLNEGTKFYFTIPKNDNLSKNKVHL